MVPDDNKPLVPTFRMRERGRPRSIVFYAIGGALLLTLVWVVTHLPSGIQQVLSDLLGVADAFS
jgi:hypothetical protein